MRVDIRSLWNFNDPAASEVRFRDAQLRAGSKDEKLELQTQIARTLGLRRRFDEARVVLNEVKAQLDHRTPRADIRYHLEIGRVENSSGNPEASIPFFEKSLDLANTAGEEFLAVDAAHMLGIAFKGDESLKWNLKAIEMAKAGKDEPTRDWQGSLLNNTAWTLYDLGRFAEALPVFEDALVFRETQGKAEATRIAKYCVGKCLRNLGRLDEALAIQLPLLDGSDGYVSEEIGECLLAQGKEADSKEHFNRAYELLSKDPWMKANEPERLDRLHKLSA